MCLGKVLKSVVEKNLSSSALRLPCTDILAMRLLHSTLLELEERADNDIPKYAILSQKWLGDPKQEVTFKDMNRSDANRKAGYSKTEHYQK